MYFMERFFRRRGFEVDNRSYPSTRKYVEDHAKDLADQLRQHAEDCERAGVECELYAVTHSLGGLILRYALTHFDVPRVRRAVLMVPPNQGAVSARDFRRFPPYRWLWGAKSAAQLAEEPPGVFAECGVPSGCEIGVIAGDVPYRLWGTSVQRPHDGVVAVDEARLPPFPLRVVPYGHTPILFVPAAWREAEYFLLHGRFSAAS